MPENNVGDQIVVTGFSPGSHFPRQAQALEYSFEANGLSKDGPFRILGSVYGKNLRFRGPGEVGGPVFGRGDVKLIHEGSGLQRFMSGVSATGNVVSAHQPRPLEDTLVGDLRRAHYAIRGDVVADNIKLSDAIVFGNLQARRIKIVNCVVFGAVIAEELAVVKASTMLHYSCPRIGFEGPCMFLHAMGESHEPPVFSPFKDGANQLWAPDHRLYPVFRDAPDAALTNRPWGDHSDAYHGASLSREIDWVEFHGQDADGNAALRHVLTIAGRALDFGALEGNIRILSQMLTSGLRFDHYSPQDQAEERLQWEDFLNADELFLMRTLTQPVEQDEQA